MSDMDAALICKALGDANRLKIMRLLSGGEKCACKLLEAFDISQPTLSHHMKILCECSLVCARREGKWTHYSLCGETLAEFRAFLDSFDCPTQEGGCSCH